MPGVNRPSQSPDAKRRRARAYRARRYAAQGASVPCRYCPEVLPTTWGRSVHETVMHRRPGALG